VVNQAKPDQTLPNAAIPFQAGAVSVACVDFEYSWKTVNRFANYRLTWLGLAVPCGGRLILIFDRGFARKSRTYNKERSAALPHLRPPAKSSCRPRRRPRRTGRAIRYAHALNHRTIVKKPNPWT